MSDQTRRARIPFSANRSKLQVDIKQKGFQYRWFNDVNGRPQRALDAGWIFVKPEEIGSVGDKEVHGGNSDLNSKVSRIVGRDAGGAGIRAYLMKISDVFFNEDLKAKAAINDRVDEAIRGGKAGGTEVEKGYGEVKLDHAAT